MEKHLHKSLEEMIASEAWDIFKSNVLGSLREQIQRNLQAETRRGDAIKAAQYVGQLDILEVVLDVPRKEIMKLKG